MCVYIQGLNKEVGVKIVGKKDHLNRLWHYSQHLETTIDFHQLQNII